MRLICATLIALLTLSVAAAAQSDAQKNFDKMKTLSGTWDGKITTTPADPQMNGTNMHVVLRTTSLGNALLHEMTSPLRKDDPITMFYLENDNLMLTHYCDAGNRPRMTAKTAADGKIDFEFKDVMGNMQYGHMHHATFTILDENHHIEEWTYMMGDKPVVARMDLQRSK